ncbi:carbonic anhydrase [Dichomitus squalens LYAD-421 SS1]|uniref:Carbonic anhydrase n=1 Tax=Dichomitus squalens (strain LYAD-421) TaxID=732165 RepID=R7SZR0_DICSQ|nr:carbonic anhydrase [Dichomitus squalens LYAD-421 SS1]EJF61458.1 carbonic anhydrase [Dichomitus squalens LYAD-421 SS1]
MATTVLNSTESPSYPEPTPIVLTRLLDQNEKWAEAHSELFPMGPQTPKVLWFGCADSRVPESVITDSIPGVIFTHRNIANQFHPEDDSAVSVLAYAVEHVKVEHIIVVGHTDCGGVKASADTAATQSPPFSRATALERWLATLTEFAWSVGPGSDITELVEANVRMQVVNVLSSEVLEHEWKLRDVHVHGWVYDLATGKLRDLGISAGRKGPVQY